MSQIEKSNIESDFGSGICVSCIGGRSENQDRCGFMNTEHGLLIVVCDGMGGAAGGATASQMAVEEIIRFVNRPVAEDDLVDDYQMLLRKAIGSANKLLLETAASDSTLHGMGTTVTAILVNDKQVTWAHVGDSRIYQLRRGHKIHRTQDHSMVFEMVKKKVLTEEQARLSAQSNIILRALGQKDTVDVDTAVYPYDKGDLFLLCTDGIWGTMPEKELIRKASSRRPISEVAEALAWEVNSHGENTGGNHDNLTAAFFKTNKKSQIRSKMEQIFKKAFLICAALLCVSLALNIVQLSRSQAKEKEKTENTTDSIQISQTVKKAFTEGNTAED